MISKLPIEKMYPLIDEMLKLNGKVSFTVSGTSMQPMLYHRRDTVTLVSPPAKLKKYDLPFYRMNDGSYILHRVVKVHKDGSYECRGDNRWESEDNIREDQIIGIVSEFTRNGKKIIIDKSFGYKLYINTWHFLHYLKKYYKYVTNLKKKLKYVFRVINETIKPDKILITIGDKVEKILVRKARKSDIKSIQDLSAELIEFENNSFDTCVTNKYWYLNNDGKKYFLNILDNHFLAVAVNKSNIVGYISGRIIRKGSNNFPIGMLLNIYIRPEFRGGGLGTKLVDMFKNYCKENDCYNLTVSFYEKNTSVEKFYRKHGFIEQTKTYICSI